MYLTYKQFKNDKVSAARHLTRAMNLRANNRLQSGREMSMSSWM